VILAVLREKGRQKMANLYVFHQGLNSPTQSTSGRLRYSYYDGANWSADTQIRNLGMSGSPSAVPWLGGITVFHQGFAGRGELWYTYSPDGINWGTTQTDAQVMGVGMSGSPSAVVYNGLLYVFHQEYGESGRLLYTFYDGANWSAEKFYLLVSMSASPSAVLWAGGITVFHQGVDNNGQLWYTYSPDGKHWGDDTPWGGGSPGFPVQDLGMSGSPSAVVYNGLLYVFHQGYGDNGQLWYTYYDGANWSPDTPIQGVSMSGSPSAVPWLGGITVFHQGYGNDGQLWYTYSPDGKQWGGDTPWGGAIPVQDLGMSESPSCVVF
jgi:hypothetical protein